MSKLRFGGASRHGQPTPGLPCHLSSQVNEHLKSLDGSFDSVWVSRHLALTPPWAHPSGPLWEGMMAWRTTRRPPELRLRTITLANSYRPPHCWPDCRYASIADPVDLPRQRRRLEEEEYLAYGYPFRRREDASTQLEEACNSSRRCGRVACHLARQLLHVAEAFSNPGRTRAEILIGGGGEQRRARVARHADWWNLPAGPRPTSPTRRILMGYCREIGRDSAEIRLSWDVAGWLSRPT